LLGEYDIPAALDHLYQIEETVSAPGVIYEFEASYLMKLNDKSNRGELITAWERLVERNPENRDYLFGLEKASALADYDARKKFWESLAAKYPRSTSIKVIPLDFLHGASFSSKTDIGDDFRAAVDTLLRQFLSKGVPSTFVSLKSLYSNLEKRRIIQDLVESWLVSLKESSRFPPKPDTECPEEAPTTLLWTLHFLALHHSHPKSHRDLPKSLQFIEEAIRHTPTLVELHLSKARFLKYKGDLNAAVDAIMVARELDLQDRFVNTKVGKYLLRANRNEEALTILKEFTRVCDLSANLT